ncbi:MAG: LemA family protein [Candidatus Marsarchaeota archaeon]|nr:LemA family protein [Candidatus Marsarchaeota archaeon]
MVDPVLIVGGLIVLVVIVLVFIFNGLVSLRARVDNAWAQIDVQLTKRYELVPNLVETVKGYAKHEKEIFENVTKARSMWAGASTVGEKAKADASFAGALKSLIAVAENYPQLKANENFRLLQEQLDGIESKVAYARQAYNDAVLEYNTKIQTVPDAFIAGLMGFVQKEYFKAEEAAREAVKVKF